MIRNYRWVEGTGLVETTNGYDPPDVHQVMPDLEPFRGSDGTFITSRQHWREHLKQTDTVEMGHSDIKGATEKWNKRKAAFQEKVSSHGQAVAEHTGPMPSLDKPQESSRLSVELANKLHGRPTPGRKEMILLALDTQRRLQRGR